jgi:hypothetical protein
MRTLRAFVIGAGTAYFLDPRQGRRRRHLVRDRLFALVRRSRRLLVKEARLASGHARALSAQVRRDGDRAERPTDPATVVQRIRSDAFREAGISTKDVDVRVDDGVATLQGSVPSDEAADALVSRVAEMPGVRDVAAMLRVQASQAA